MATKWQSDEEARSVEEIAALDARLAKVMAERDRLQKQLEAALAER